MDSADFVLHPIGRVSSSLTQREQAPNQADEGAPGAWLVFEPVMAEALSDISVGAELLLFTWLDRARRDVLSVQPRGDASRSLTGVFSTRSPDRPNPIGLHHVTVAEVSGTRVRVLELEALDGTPILDLKPVLTSIAVR